MKSPTTSRRAIGLNLRSNFLGTGSGEKISPLAAEILDEIESILKLKINVQRNEDPKEQPLREGHIQVPKHSSRYEEHAVPQAAKKGAMKQQPAHKILGSTDYPNLDITFKSDFLADAITKGIQNVEANKPSKDENFAYALKELLDTKDFTTILDKFDEGNDFDLTNIIQRSGDTSLYFEVKDRMDAAPLTFTQHSIFTIDSILQYLFLKAKYVLGCQDAASILDSISDTNSDVRGTKPILKYVYGKAITKIKQSENLDLNTYDKNGASERNAHAISAAILTALEKDFPPMSDSQFRQKTKAAIVYQVENHQALKLLKKAEERGVKVDEQDIPATLKFFKQDGGKNINEDNAHIYAAQEYSSQRRQQRFNTEDSTEEISSDDFQVNFYNDTAETAVFIKENVLCAGQLFYVMTLADELNIFGVVNRITSKYLPSGMVDIRSKEMLLNLQQYVFNDSFKDTKTGTIYNKTQPEERNLFYKQVFNYGNGETAEDMVLNTDFSNLWDTLMLECAKYRNKVEKSINPEFFVSRQNVIQAADDLRYNLSTHCTGMTKVVTPVISKEMDFVIEKILKNEDVIRQLALNRSGSFWKVVERVLQDMNHETPNITALNKKAETGYSIINTLGSKSNAELEDTEVFNKFMQDVESYIIANSQLENRREMNDNEDDSSDDESGNYKMNGKSEMVADDWNF